MENLDIYFTQEKIIKYLCKQRAKLAKKRCEDYILCKLSTNIKFNYNVDIHKQNKSMISLIMPSRRSWVNIGQQKRTKNSAPLNSIEKNAMSIYQTIQKDRLANKQLEYIVKLDSFVKEIQDSLNNPRYKINKPKVRPELKGKENGEIIYRPISSFDLKDSLLICFVNKYLSKVFDELIYEHAYAFRSSRTIGDEYRPPNHHDAFRKIAEYRNAHKESKIYVAECDMKKFFDTVNHKLLLKSFKLLEKKLPHGTSIDIRAKKIFRKYLDSYYFPINVAQYNNNKEYFRKYKMTPGVFGWITNNDIKQAYPLFLDRKIGVPQGGALSGLIANIVLWTVDKKVMGYESSDFLYIRYCDDMIMMHTNQEKCRDALRCYENELKKMKLIPHPVSQSNYGKQFWSVKSKGPYLWSFSAIPWVGFVGYEVNRNGDIRARNKSLKKEHRKQEEIVSTVINAIGNNNLKVSKSAVYESTRERLIGMAVGRVTLWNYKSYKNDLCWVNGFKLLNCNKYTKRQLRLLDRSRNRYLHRLLSHLKTIPDTDINTENQHVANKQIYYTGKPFSYYFHIIEKS